MLELKLIFGDGAFHSVREKPLVQGLDLSVAVLPKGLSSGKPSIAIGVNLPDGSFMLVETSAALYCTAAKAIMAKYPNLFDGENIAMDREQ